MTDPDASAPNTGQTVELALGDLRRRLPAGREDLRDQLPGLEPERHVTDWGRSERFEALVDRTLSEFLYHYWFRVEVEGMENVPKQGGALLVANHSGALPSDGAMIAKAVREEHPLRRPVHLTTGRQLSGFPGLGMVVTKLGGVSAHPANVQRLLFDEGQLVLVFPEGRRGRDKPVKDRYRLRWFAGPGFVDSALRAGVPIVPLAVLGAEEAQPVLARVNPLRRLTRLPALPLMAPFPLPAKFKLRFLQPVLTDALGEAPWQDRGLVQAIGDDIRGLIQENLFEMVGARRSVWLG